jgi:3',5'-cyclic AMP phosphodiesterase CpdA
VRTLVQLSDLHFGAINARTLAPLRDKVRALAPNLVIVSGDLTQRAKPHQFEEARAWLDTLPTPQVVVPGNHDVPLYNVAYRFLAPLRRYRRHFSRELEPSYVDEEIAVMGVSTARSLVFKGGRINEAQIERVRETFCKLPDTMTKIVVTHHPFDLPDDWQDQSQVAGRAAKALRQLSNCGADVYVSGHLHKAHSGELASPLELPGLAPLFVAAGTSTSTRGRGEKNAFNVLHVDRDAIAIELFEWDDARADFAPASRKAFQRRGRRWQEAGAP